MHPRRLRCSSLKYSRYSRSSRLAGGAPRPSRCDARLSPRAAKGRITKLATGMGHGFIQAGDREVFFHRADLIEIKFNDLVVGGAGSFEVIEDPVSGPQAIHVRGPAGAHD